MLLQQGRYVDAEFAGREALARDPDDAFLLYMLALAQYQQDDGEVRALPTANRAIALEPADASYHALRSRILLELHRLDEADASADEAIRLGPGETEGHVARGFVRFRRQDWAGAEKCAREALELDPEDGGAAHLLTESLRLQGRANENREVLEERLARDPLDPNAHVSLGWRALQADRRDAAEEHFLEALRLDPGHEAARIGLLEAFKSRAPWYRAWLRLNLWSQRFSQQSRWFVIGGLFVLTRFARVLFKGPLAPIGLLATVLWLFFALWSHLASGSANFIVLLDSRARHALRRPERLEAVAVGGCMCLGLLLGVIGMLPGTFLVSAAGLFAFAASIPFAYTFTNKSLAGSRLFAGVAAVSLLAGAMILVAHVAPMSMPPTAISAIVMVAAGGVIATTWLANVPALRR
jgi:tetratricopeptide (TPR) repeat protein